MTSKIAPDEMILDPNFSFSEKLDLCQTGLVGIRWTLIYEFRFKMSDGDTCIVHSSVDRDELDKSINPVAMLNAAIENGRQSLADLVNQRLNCTHELACEHEDHCCKCGARYDHP